MVAEMKKFIKMIFVGILILETSVVNATGASVLSEKEPIQDFDGNVVEAGNQVSELNLTCKGAMLLEASTGTVLFEKDSDQILSPASITKIMTLILTFDALQEGKIKMNDVVTTSEHAKSMGGSQVFLETGEQQTVETLIKCIVVASGNDASVAMAEHIAGSEEEFVKRMNQRANELGMKHTHFVDCCGLTDADEHYTTARDVALMSRELLTKYPQITKYSTIWMENITHKTKLGEKEFTLANTNKLLKQYAWATGLKTGSTQKAKYCLSATAKKDGIELIAVVMGAENYKLRFKEAMELLNYGYANCKKYQDKETEKIKVKISGGAETEAEGYVKQPFSYIAKKEENPKEIKKKVIFEESLKAPIQKDQKIGKIQYLLNEKKIGERDILAKKEVESLQYKDYFQKIIGKYLLDVL